MITSLEPLWSAQRELAAYWRTTYYNASFMWSGADAWNANMQDVKRRIDELAPDGRLGIAVVNGGISENGTLYPFTPEKWKSIHHTLWDSVTAQAKINNQSPSLWNDFVVPSGEEIATHIGDTATAIKDKADFLTSPLGLLLIFSILLMAVVWRVSD